MKVLVTGSTGQIGSFVVDQARASGLTPVGFDLRASGWTSIVGDLRSSEVCLRAVEGCEAVIHCAAQVSVQSSLDDPRGDADHNICGTLNLLEAARRSGVRRFVAVSSAAVYGLPVRSPIGEDHPTSPLSPYGLSKLAVENYVRLYRELHGLDTVVVRPFNVYSRRQDPANPYTGVMSKFALRVRAGQSPVIFGDGLQTRDFVHAEDVAAWLVALVDSKSGVPSGVTMNLGTGKEVSIVDLCRLFIEASGSLALVPMFAPGRPGEVSKSVADVAFARGFGFRPRVSLQEGIRELVISAVPYPGEAVPGSKIAA